MKKALLIGVIGIGFAMMYAHANEYVTTPHQKSEVINNTNIKMRAQKWEISEQEYQRYLEIMNGPLSRWNENIDPVFALGIYAESEAQQRKYAELLARQEYNLALRTIEFERAYRAAFKRLFPDAKIVDPQLMQAYYQRKSSRSSISSLNNNKAPGHRFKPGDRVLYFVNRHRCRGCAVNVNLLSNILKDKKGVMIDIYVIDAEEDSEVNEWANTHKIDASLVGDRITLNADSGLYQRILDSSPGLSGRLFLSRSNQLYKIDKQQLGL